MQRSIIAFATATVAAAILPTAALAQATVSDQVPPPRPITTKLGSTPLTEFSDGGAGLPILSATESYGAGDLAATLREFHDSGAYDKEVAAIDTLAERHVDQVAVRASDGPKQPRSAAAAGRAQRRDKLAIVLDVDETALSNYAGLNADNFTVGANTQAGVATEAGVAIAPTLKLFNDARRHGVAVFLITGRPVILQQVTEDNLRKQGFSDWASVTSVPTGSTMSTVAFKSTARAAIEGQGYKIIANVGDEYSDLAGGHADSDDKLPNPFYYTA
jgi:HAD superfamily, subfamily IIIB (Acid phosphatase)